MTHLTPYEICTRIRKHYGLNRPVTEQEAEAEIANLKRRGPDNLDDRQHLLAAALNVFNSQHGS